MKTIIIKEVHEYKGLTKEALNVIKQFNNSGKKLKLEVYSWCQNDELENILEEAMYDYNCDKELANILNEMVDFACPMVFEVQDVLEVI